MFRDQRVCVGFFSFEKGKNKMRFIFFIRYVFLHLSDLCAGSFLLVIKHFSLWIQQYFSHFVLVLNKCYISPDEFSFFALFYCVHSALTLLVYLWTFSLKWDFLLPSFSARKMPVELYIFLYSYKLTDFSRVITCFKEVFICVKPLST